MAGITSEAEESAISEQVVWAVAEAKLCSTPSPFSPFQFQMPPRKKHMPMTSNRFERMDPSMDDCTTWIWPSLSATILTCNPAKSVTFPLISP